MALLWAFWPEFAIVQRARRAAGTEDAKSLQVIMLGQGIASVAAFPLAWVPDAEPGQEDFGWYVNYSVGDQPYCAVIGHVGGEVWFVAVERGAEAFNSGTELPGAP